MKQGDHHRLGVVQLELMKVVWEKGKATVRDVVEAIAGRRKMAYSTVLTMLRDLEGKGMLTHEVRGQTYVYRPAVSRKRITRCMIKDLTSRLFDNSAAALVSHLLEVENIPPRELERMKQMIAEKERDRGNGQGR